MSSFQKLMVGALERIAKRQAELDELQKAAAKRIALEGAGNSMFANPEIAPQGPLTLMHGSPFKFDQFDFEGNMLKGEGAMAFGPGGYMTGHEPLAKSYAKNLYEKHAGRANILGAHPVLRAAAVKNPVEIAEFLRARNVAKGLGEKLDRPAVGTGLRDMRRLPPHLADRYEPQGSVANWRQGQPPEPQYIFKTEGRAQDFDAYREAMLESGLSRNVIEQLGKSARVGRGGLAPSQAVNIGGALRNVIEKSYGGANLRPRLSERMSYMPQAEYDDLLHRQRRDPKRGLSTYYGDLPADTDYYTGPGSLRSVDPALRQNLNSTWRAVNNRPGNKAVKVSMSQSGQGGGAIDFNALARYKAAIDGSNNSEFARRLYRAQFDASFADMLPYDYPIATMKPEKLGALAQLAERHSFLDALNPELTGQDFLRLLRESKSFYGKGRAGELAQIQALKEAGVPATFFLRGGRRSDTPSKVNPADFNYVIHDQRLLGRPDVEEFAVGGRV